MMDPFQYESDLEEYSAGDTIFRAGDEGHRMYVLASGKVEIMVGETVVEFDAALAEVGVIAVA